MPVRTLDHENLAYHRGRLLALEEDTRARWGGMDAMSMVCHLRASVEASLGEIEVPRLMSPLLGKPLGFLFFHVLPRWPRGKKGAKPPIAEMHPAPTLSFREERQRLLAAADRFVARAESDPHERFPHPVAGMTTLRGWSRIHGLHFRHHYRQFGLD
jgi:hypothetical protein